MASEPCRLYVSGAILGYKRGLRNQYNSTSLIKIAGVDSKEETEFYHQQFNNSVLAHFLFSNLVGEREVIPAQCMEFTGN